MYLLNERNETNPLLHPIKYLHLTKQIRKAFNGLEKYLEEQSKTNNF